MTDLRRIFNQVGWYSAQVQQSRPLSKDELKHRVFWAKEYLLGAHRELSDMLNALPEWKPHRKEAVPSPIDLDAVTEEAVDVVNYVVATLSAFDISEQQFSQVWKDKWAVLLQQRRQEVNLPLVPNEPVFMVDLDGCLADFRTGFLQWLRSHYPRESPTEMDPVQSINLDLEFNIEPSRYRQFKHEFELQGGYRNLPPMPCAYQVWLAIRQRPCRPVFVTSRPASLKRVHRDTLAWLDHFTGGIPAKAVIQVTSQKAEWLQQTGVKVVGCLEDDPKQVRRLAAQGYNVLVPAMGYNEGVDHGQEERIRRVPANQLADAIGAVG